MLAYDCDMFSVLINSNTYLRVVGGSHGYSEPKGPANGPFLHVDSYLGLHRLDIGACLRSLMIVTGLIGHWLLIVWHLLLLEVVSTNTIFRT